MFKQKFVCSIFLSIILSLIVPITIQAKAIYYKVDTPNGETRGKIKITEERLELIQSGHEFRCKGVESSIEAGSYFIRLTINTDKKPQKYHLSYRLNDKVGEVYFENFKKLKAKIKDLDVIVPDFGRGSTLSISGSKFSYSYENITMISWQKYLESKPNYLGINCSFKSDQDIGGTDFSYSKPIGDYIANEQGFMNPKDLNLNDFLPLLKNLAKLVTDRETKNVVWDNEGDCIENCIFYHSTAYSLPQKVGIDADTKRLKSIAEQSGFKKMKTIKGVKGLKKFFKNDQLTPFKDEVKDLKDTITKSYESGGIKEIYYFYYKRENKHILILLDEHGQAYGIKTKKT